MQIVHMNRELMQSLYDKLHGGAFYENHDDDMVLVGELRKALEQQPKTPRLAVMAVAQQVVDALEADRKSEGYDLEAGMFGPAFSNILRKWAALEYAARPNTARAVCTTEAEGDAYVLGWFDGQGWGFPTPRDESTISNARAAFKARSEPVTADTLKRLASLKPGLIQIMPDDEDTKRLDWLLPVVSGESNSTADGRTMALAIQLSQGIDGRAAIDAAMAVS